MRSFVFIFFSTSQLNLNIGDHITPLRTVFDRGRARRSSTRPARQTSPIGSDSAEVGPSAFASLVKCECLSLSVCGLPRLHSCDWRQNQTWLHSLIFNFSHTILIIGNVFDDCVLPADLLQVAAAVKEQLEQFTLAEASSGGIYKVFILIYPYVMNGCARGYQLRGVQDSRRNQVELIDEVIISNWYGRRSLIDLN